MDIFSVFHHAHLVYEKLQQDNPGININVPALDTQVSDASPELNLNIVINKDKQGAPATSVTGEETPLKVFGRLPQEIRGDIADVQKRLSSYITDVGNIQVDLYRQYSSALSQRFDGLISAFANVFQNIVMDYFKLNEPVIDQFALKIKFSYPACVVVYWQAKNVALKYTFHDMTLTLSGFADEALLDYSAHVGSLPVEINSMIVKEGVVSEAISALLVTFPGIISRLDERVFMYQQTADDMLDQIIQKLVVLDLLDALQDVVIEEDGGLFLFFDPILEQDEIETTVTIIKEAYPQAVLVSTPDDEESEWWVIEVRKLVDTAVQVSNAGMDKPVERNPEGIIAKSGQGTMQAIAQGIDVDAALQAVGSEG